MEEQKGNYELTGNRKPEKVQEESTSSALKWQVHALICIIMVCGYLSNVFKATPKDKFYTLVTLNYFFITVE